MRMMMRRFTRLTNGFSKQVENHAAMFSLYFCAYNFCRVHQTLRVTPAMEAGVSDHVWGIDEMVSILNAKEGESQRRKNSNCPTTRRPARPSKAVSRGPVN